MTTFETKCSFCGKPVIRKQVMTAYYCDINCKASWQKLQKPVTKEWLVDAYLGKGLNCTEIAHIVKRDPKSVWNWLKDLGIETRKRGKTDNWKFVKNPYWKGKKLPQEMKSKIRAASLKDGRVPYLKNGKHWMHETGRKPASWRGGITPDRQALYSSLEWKECIKEVWKRDNATCQRCGLDHRIKGKGERKFHIHHINSFSIKEDRAKVSNLVLLCHPCHMWIHSKQNKGGLYIGKGH